MNNKNEPPKLLNFSSAFNAWEKLNKRINNDINKEQEKVKIAIDYFKKIVISDTRKNSLDLTPTYLAQKALEKLND